MAAKGLEQADAGPRHRHAPGVGPQLAPLPAKEASRGKGRGGVELGGQRVPGAAAELGGGGRAWPHEDGIEEAVAQLRDAACVRVQLVFRHHAAGLVEAEGVAAPDPGRRLVRPLPLLTDPGRSAHRWPSFGCELSKWLSRAAMVRLARVQVHAGVVSESVVPAAPAVAGG